MSRHHSLKPGGPLKGYYIAMSLAAVVGIAILFSAVRTPAVAVTQPVPVELSPAELARVQGVSVGRTDAPIVIYQFTDYQCPSCARYAAFVEPLIMERLVASGKARYVFYDFPLGGRFVHGFLASRAGRCADEQGRFWEWHALALARQADWSAASDAFDLFTLYAGQVGLDTREFAGCLRSDRYAREVSESRALGDMLGVRGTPTLVINGQRLGGVPGSYAEFEEMLREIFPEVFAAAP
jgi:protein-disulfide isomerase